MRRATIRGLNHGIFALPLFASILFASSDAHASAGTLLADSSRAAGLADAVSARPGDAGTMLENPAGLADLTEPMLLSGAHAAYVSQYVQPMGQASQDHSRGLGGFSVAIGAPLPGPPWAKRIVFGATLDLPAQYILRVQVPVRTDAPFSPIYDNRPDRISATLGFGFRILDRLQLGVGLAVTPSIFLPVNVQYLAGRSQNVNDNVIVRADDSLNLSGSGFVGLRAEPIDALGLALVFRDAQVSHAQGSQTTTAGGIEAIGPLNYFEMWNPRQITFGGSYAFTKRLSLSLDVTWNEWSSYRSAFDTPLGSPSAPAFHDTVSVASGVEASITRALVLRGGVGLEPSPIPAQNGDTNYIGADTFIVALGGGLDFRRFSQIPVVVDLHARARIDARQSATKDPAALTDADSTLPGQQIDNVTYPGFHSRATAIDGGISITIFPGGDAK